MSDHFILDRTIKLLLPVMLVITKRWSMVLAFQESIRLMKIFPLIILLNVDKMDE